MKDVHKKVLEVLKGTHLETICYHKKWSLMKYSTRRFALVGRGRGRILYYASIPFDSQLGRAILAAWDDPIG